MNTNSDGWPTQQQWAVFAGGQDPDDAAMMELYDDSDEALSDLPWVNSGGMAYRTVAYGPWTVSHPAGTAITGMDKVLVRKALERVINMADYDLAKSFDADCNETGEDGWPELVDLFVEAYEGA